MFNLSKLLFCAKNCMQLPTLEHLYVPLFQKEEEMGNLAQNHKGHYLRSCVFTMGSGALFPYVLEQVHEQLAVPLVDGLLSSQDCLQPVENI